MPRGHSLHRRCLLQVETQLDKKTPADLAKAKAKKEKRAELAQKKAKKSQAQADTWATSAKYRLKARLKSCGIPAWWFQGPLLLIH